MENENSIDELTRLFNRRGINQQLKRFSKINDDRLEVVFIVDIDYFKQYNDYWGHLQGDACLKLIASSLMCEGEECFQGRFGGEEFLCYYRVKDHEEAGEIGKNLRLAIENLQIPYTKEKQRSITVSVGGKCGKIHAGNISGFIGEADKALYQAKENGRNQVIIIT